MEVHKLRNFGYAGVGVNMFAMETQCMWLIIFKNKENHLMILTQECTMCLR